MRVIYISHNELASPLVQSQVLPYLDGLADQVRFDLVTFERGDENPTPPRHRWHPVRSRRGADLVAKAVDIARGVAAVARLAVTGRATLIHARSYVAAMVALVAGSLSRRPYVFDMRGFLGDEYVDAGYWRPNELRYRVLRAAESVLLRRAAAIVVLTRVAERRLRTERRFASAARVPVTVIPCAVDLAIFRPAAIAPRVPTLVYTGSLGSFYRLDDMLRVYAAARAIAGELRFLILNRSDHALIEAAVTRLRVDGDIRVEAVGHGGVPARLRECSVGIAFVEQRPSKSGSSAIKVSEYLASGLPVVVNSGLGDTDRLVETYGAGHVVASYETQDLDRAAAAVVSLMADEQARLNARRLAEEVFDLNDAVEHYRDVYRAAAAGLTSRDTRGRPG